MNNQTIKYLSLTIFILIHINIHANESIEIHHCDIYTNYILTNISKDSLEILKKKVICEGDTSAYIEIMKYVPYYDYFVYSIIMADIYQYPKAFYKAYRIFDLWLKLYNSKIDTDIKHNLSFWLKFGSDCENESCKTILNDTNNNISENELKKMDSVNNFIFYIQHDTIIKYIKLTLGDWTQSMLYEDFLNCKKNAIKKNEKNCFHTLNMYAHSDNNNGFSINEYFLFRIYEFIINQYYSDVTGGIIWHLNQSAYLCYMPHDISSFFFFTSELGLYLLNLGAANQDEFSYLALAELYAKGIAVPQDIEYARKILKNKFSDQVINRLIKQWLNQLSK